MATEVREIILDDAGAAELTTLGKRVEILRIERGLSKQRLARHAGTSRQQLWRVMTGKSELTPSLRERLASALAVESAVIASGARRDTNGAAHGVGLGTALPVTIAEYLADPHHIAATLRTLPSGDAGLRLRRALLGTLADLAAEGGHAVPTDVLDPHRGGLAGEI